MEDDFHVKILTVKPGESLSLQSHKHRSENWVVVKGNATVEISGHQKIIKVGESVYIPKRAKHRLENKHDENLIIVEVQTGDYFGEDDIKRYNDKYSR